MIAIGSDHRGYKLKEEIKKYLNEIGLSYKDFGANSEERVDTLPIVTEVCTSIQEKECNRGILICGTGIGMSILGNKVKGIRASLCHNIETAKLTKQHNNANILVLAALSTSKETAEEIVMAFLEEPFSKKERHIRRIKKIIDYENNINEDKNGKN